MLGSLKSRIPAPLQVARWSRVLERFPLAILAAVLLTGFLLLELQRVLWPSDLAWRLPVALATIMLWAAAASLVAQARGWPLAPDLSLGIGGAVVIALVSAAGQRAGFSAPMLAAGVAGLLLLAPYLRRGAYNPAFWRYAHDLAVNVTLAALAVALFAGGLSAILETLRYLFGLSVAPILHEKIWVLAGCLVGPVYALSLLPEDLSRAVEEGEQHEFTSAAIAVLVKFILAPLLLVYAAILHVYALQIAITATLPKGRLGWLVLSFGAVLVTTALAAYPTRTSGGRVVQLFWRLWPWALVVPVILLFVAVAARLAAYGLTEARYVVLLAGVWLAAVALLHGPLRRTDLRLVPGVLTALLLGASLGPWSVTWWPERSQVAAFVARAAAAGLVRDGRVVADAPPAPNLGDADRERLHGILTWLASRQRLEALRPLFAGVKDDPFAAATGAGSASAGSHEADVLRGNQPVLANRIRDRLGLGRPQGRPAGSFVGYYASATASVAVPAGTGQLLGPVHLTAPDTSGASKSVETPQGRFTFALRPTHVTVSVGDREVARFELAPVLAKEGPLTQASTTPAQQRAPLLIDAVSGGAALIAYSINGASGAGGAAVTGISFWLLLPDQPKPAP